LIPWRHFALSKARQFFDGREYLEMGSCGITIGRERVSREVRELVFQMVPENSKWVAPCIRGELLKLDLVVTIFSIRVTNT